VTEYREEHEAARAAGLRARHETRLRRAIRREVAEEIAQAIEATTDDRYLIGPMRAARIAREIGSKEASDG